jgi:5-methylcytosine-specific restriction protein B
MREDPVLVGSEPMRFRCQGSLFALTATEADRILLRLRDADPTLTAHTQTSTARLTRITFHPSYTYEDFVEGFRPNPTGAGGLELKLIDGVFKKLCVAAAAAPHQSFVLLIDEINRGNIAKILGELITIIEHDKRGLSVRLPQSGDDFTVPKNVYIIGTMNTADRSIQLLDTALRRRFRFIELMPDSEVLEGANIGGLSLAIFLDVLNERIRTKVGRERQIGHAAFFQNGKVINTTDAFSEVFRHELLPTLQEYLYDNYADLADVLGSDIVDPERERVTAHLDDPDTLCTKLAEAFGAQTAQ